MGKLENANILEMVNGRAKQSEIWDMGAGIICVLGTFDLLVLIVVLGSFSALVSKWPATQKQLVVEQNGMKSGNQGVVLT